MTGVQTCALPIFPALACVALTTVLSTGCELAAEGSGPAASGSFDRTLQVNGPVTLSVTNGSGDVTIVPGQDGSVHVVGRIRASASLLGGLGGATADDKIQKLSANPPIVQEGSRIRIGEITDQSLRNGVTITYEIAVPVATQLKSRVGSGNETVGAIAVEVGDREKLDAGMARRDARPQRADPPRTDHRNAEFLGVHRALPALCSHNASAEIGRAHV